MRNSRRSLLAGSFALPVIAATLLRTEYIAFLERDLKTWGVVVAKGNIKIDQN